MEKKKTVLGVLGNQIVKNVTKYYRAILPHTKIAL